MKESRVKNWIRSIPFTKSYLLIQLHLLLLLLLIIRHWLHMLVKLAEWGRLSKTDLPFPNISPLGHSYYSSAPVPFASPEDTPGTRGTPFGASSTTTSPSSSSSSSSSGCLIILLEYQKTKRRKFKTCPKRLTTSFIS